MFAAIESQETFPVAMNNGTGDNHLGIKPGAAGEQPQECAAVPVRDIHHGRHGKFPAGK